MTTTGQTPHWDIAAGGANNFLDFFRSDVGTVMTLRADQRRVGMGTNAPDSALEVRSFGADDAFRVRIGSSTKLLVGSNGGLSVGGNFGSTVTDNGMRVAGQVGIGRAAERPLDVLGETRTTTLTITGGSDLAEAFDVRSTCEETEIAPGMLVVIDPERPGKLMLSTRAYDRRVAGVISGANGLSPGMVMRAEGHEHADGDHHVALTGRVWCFADATEHAIEPGDLLTTSERPGHAMRACDRDRAFSATIGKAMTPLARGERGLVLILVNLQ
jgi:hypothetical protein